MSDRIILSLAAVPMISGILLVSLLQRGAARFEQRKVLPGFVAGIVPPPDAQQTWPGVVVAELSAELASEYDGRIARVFLRNGAPVEAGAPILEIERENATAASQIARAELAQRASERARAEARAHAAREKLARVEAGSKWLSVLEVDSARAELQVALAELSAASSAVAMGQARLAQQNLRVRRHTIVAPFGGTITSVNVDPGDSVGIGRIVARVIGDNRRVRFALPREQLEAGDLREIWVRSEGLERHLRARVEAVEVEVDAAAQLVFATASLPERTAAAGWLPGVQVEVVRAIEPVPEQGARH